MATHVHRIRVRYAETDQMGIAHHASFVVWLEEARIEWLRAQGTTYKELEASGVLMPVVELSVRYMASLRFDDIAELTTTVERLGPTRLAFRSVLHHAGRACAEASVTIAAVNRDGRPVRIPSGLIEAAAQK